jgi:16S rRNA processing protein RimM
MNDEFYYLGKITKLFSFKGELVFFFDVDDVSEYYDIQNVFIEIQNDIIPFFIEKINFKNNNATVKLQDIDSESDAKRMVNSKLYMPISSLPKLEGNKFYYHEVIGFEVFDVNEGRVGVIESINDQAAQALFEIKEGYTEILLPIVDDFINEIDRKNKKVIVTFPEGLLDIYKEKEED